MTTKEFPARDDVEELRADSIRYKWLANRVLACDYGDNDATGNPIGWRIRYDIMDSGDRRQPPVMFGKSIDEAIDAAIKEETNDAVTNFVASATGDFLGGHKCEAKSGGKLCRICGGDITL